AQVVDIVILDRLGNLVRLLDDIRFDRLPRLLAVPWTAARGAQPLHDAHQLRKRLGSTHGLVASARSPGSQRAPDPPSVQRILVGSPPILAVFRRLWP